MRCPGPSTNGGSFGVRPEAVTSFFAPGGTMSDAGTVSMKGKPSRKMLTGSAVGHRFTSGRLMLAPPSPMG